MTAVDPQTLSVERPPTANAAPRFYLHFIQETEVPSLSDLTYRFVVNFGATLG